MIIINNKNEFPHSEFLILVDHEDNENGVSEKMTAHKKGLMHRAFSVVLFNEKGEMLLQKRAIEKYHSGGMWSNTACGHPRPGESTLSGAERRLFEEMGIKTEIKKAFDLVYRVELENGLIENEFDHVFFGKFSKLAVPDPMEVMEWRFVSIEQIETELRENPVNFTPWFHLLFSKLLKEFHRGISKSA